MLPLLYGYPCYMATLVIWLPLLYGYPKLRLATIKMNVQEIVNF